MFYDSFLAAKYLEEHAPTAFKDLTNFPVTFWYGKGGHFYSDSKPTIALRRRGEVSFILFPLLS